MKNVTLTLSNIEKLSSLIAFVPTDTFAFVPLKISKNDDGQCIASIAAKDLNGSVIFSAENYLDDISELELNDSITIRLSLAKSALSLIFSDNFEELILSESKIIAKNSKSKITIALYEMSSKTNDNIPLTNIELYRTTLTKKNIDPDSIPHIKFDITPDELRDILDNINILVNPEALLIKNKVKNNSILVSCSDCSGNDTEYILTKESESTNNSQFLIKLSIAGKSAVKNIIQKLSKCNEYEISLLLCQYMAVFTIIGNNLTVTIGIPAFKD